MPLADTRVAEPSRNNWHKNLIVSFELPRVAAKKLHDLAVSGDRRLKEIGVLKVQIHEQTEEWHRLRRSSDLARIGSSPKSQALNSGPPVVTLNTSYSFPWQHQQAPLQFTYYTSSQPPQQLVRDRTDVRLYSLPTSEPAGHRTKIIGISRGVLTDESTPVDSRSQEPVPSWIIESSLCISFRRHGKCDVACQTGSERIMYRPRPGFVRQDAPAQTAPVPGVTLAENNGRYNVYGSKDVAGFNLNTEKSSSSKVASRGQCSSESIRILESLANSLVTAGERSEEALSGAYPISKKSKEEVRDQAKDIVRSESKVINSLEKTGNGPAAPKQTYPNPVSYQDFLYSGENRASNRNEVFYKQPVYVPPEEVLWSKGVAGDSRRTVEENGIDSYVRRLSKENDLMRKEILKLETRLPQETMPVRGHVHQQKTNNEKFSVEVEGDKRHAPAAGILQETKANKTTFNVGVAERRTEKQEKRLMGAEVEQEKERKQSLVEPVSKNDALIKDSEVDNQIVENRVGVDEARTSIESEEQKSEENKIADDKSSATCSTPSVVPINNFVGPATSYGFPGGSLPISVSLDSDYLRGITSRGSDGKHKRPVVKEDNVVKASLSQQEDPSESQTGVVMKRKRRRSSKSDLNMPHTPLSEAAKRKRGRPPKLKTDNANIHEFVSENLGAGLDAQVARAEDSPKEGDISERLDVEEVKSDMADKKEVKCPMAMVKVESETKLTSSGIELHRQETQRTSPNGDKDSVENVTVSDKLRLKGDNHDSSYVEVFTKPSEMDFSGSVGSVDSCARGLQDTVKMASKGNGKNRPSPPSDSGSLVKSIPTTSSLPLRWQTQSSSSRPTSPCDMDMKVRSRSHRWYQKDSIHREIEELYFRSYPSVACETEQPLPDDIYYGENYPIIFADDEEIAMKFVDMSTAFKLAMKGRVATNYSSRDEKRGLTALPKVRPQQDIFKKDPGLCEKILRKRTSAESRSANGNQTKRRSIDYNDDVEFVADKSMRRGAEEEDAKPSHQMSLRPRRTKTIRDDYLSSDSLEGDDTEPDTGSLYESDESSDSEPLINKVRNAGKTREKFSKQVSTAQKQSVSSDDDGETSKKMSYFTETSGLGRELNRSESVSTIESDTFDLIPSRKKNLQESTPNIKLAMNTSELKDHMEISCGDTIDGHLGEKGSSQTQLGTNDDAEELARQSSTKEVQSVTDSPQNSSDSHSMPVTFEELPYEIKKDCDKTGGKVDVEDQSEITLDMKVTDEVGVEDERMEEGSYVNEAEARKEGSVMSLPKALTEDKRESGSKNSKEGASAIEKGTEKDTMKQDTSTGGSMVPISELLAKESGHVLSDIGHVLSGSGHVLSESGHVLSESGHVFSEKVADKSVEIAFTSKETESAGSSQKEVAESCYDEAASVGDSHEGGLRVTRLLKRSIQKISETLVKGKDKLVCKIQDTVKKPTVEGDVKALCVPGDDKESQVVNDVVPSDDKKGEEGLESWPGKSAIDNTSSVGLVGNDLSKEVEVSKESIKGDDDSENVETRGEAMVRNTDDRNEEYLKDSDHVTMEGLEVASSEWPSGAEVTASMLGSVSFEKSGEGDDNGISNQTVVDLSGKDGRSTSERMYEEESREGDDAIVKKADVPDCEGDNCVGGSEKQSVSINGVPQESAISPRMLVPASDCHGGIDNERDSVTCHSEVLVESDANAHAEESILEAVLVDQEDDNIKGTRDALKEGTAHLKEVSTVSQISAQVAKENPEFAESSSCSRVSKDAEVEKGFLSDENESSEPCSIANKVSDSVVNAIGQREELTRGLKDEADEAFAFSTHKEAAESLHEATPEVGGVSDNEGGSIKNCSPCVVGDSDLPKYYDEPLPKSTKMSPCSEKGNGADKIEDNSTVHSDDTEELNGKLADAVEEEKTLESSDKIESASSSTNGALLDIIDANKCVIGGKSEEKSLQRDTVKFEEDHNDKSSSKKSEDFHKDDIVELQGGDLKFQEVLCTKKEDDLSVPVSVDQRIESCEEIVIEKEQDSGTVRSSEKSTTEFEDEKVAENKAREAVRDNIELKIEHEDNKSEQKCEEMRGKEDDEEGSGKMEDEKKCIENTDIEANGKDIESKIESSEKLENDKGTNFADDKEHNNKNNVKNFTDEKNSEQDCEGSNIEDNEAVGRKTFDSEEGFQERGSDLDFAVKGGNSELIVNKELESDRNEMSVNKRLSVSRDPEETHFAEETNSDRVAADGCNVEETPSSDCEVLSRAGSDFIPKGIDAEARLENEVETVLDLPSFGKKATVDLVSRDVPGTKKSSNVTGTSKRQIPDGENEPSARKMIKLDTGEGDTIDTPYEVELSSEKGQHPSEDVVCDKENRKEGKLPEDFDNHEPSKKIKLECVGCSSEVEDSAQRKFETGKEIDDGAASVEKEFDSKSQFVDVGIENATFDRPGNECDAVDKQNVGEEDDLYSVNSKGKGSFQKCCGSPEKDTHEYDTEGPKSMTCKSDLDVTGVESEVQDMKSKVASDKSEDVEKDEACQKDLDCELRVELTDALERIRQYEESSDEESLTNMSTESQEGPFGESHATQNTAVIKSGSTQIGQAPNQSPDDISRGADSFTGRARRYSTTESDTKQRSEKPKRRKSAADSDLSDGSHVVLTRRMRRETVGSPAKRLRSSKP